MSDAQAAVAALLNNTPTPTNYAITDCVVDEAEWLHILIEDFAAPEERAGLFYPVTNSDINSHCEMRYSHLCLFRVSTTPPRTGKISTVVQGKGAGVRRNASVFLVDGRPKREGSRIPVSLWDHARNASPLFRV